MSSAGQANYQFTNVVAEVANTFSNVITLAFALYGARKAVENRLPGRLHWGHYVRRSCLCHTD
jgi:hypothetical protein